MDAALGFQKRNYEVEIFTSHHNPAHCFGEARRGPYVHIKFDLGLTCRRIYICLRRHSKRHTCSLSLPYSFSTFPTTLFDAPLALCGQKCDI